MSVKRSAVIMFAGLMLLLGASVAAHIAISRRTPAIPAKERDREVTYGVTKEVDLGTIIADDLLSYELRLTLLNPFHEPLTIDKIETSCGCLDVNVFPKTIPADGIAELRLQVTLGERRNKKAIRVSFLSASHDRWDMRITAFFISSSFWEPNDISLGELPPDTPHVFHAILFAPSRGPERPATPAVHCEPVDRLIVKSFELAASERATTETFIHQYELAVEVRPSETDRYIRGRVWVTDENGRSQELSVSWSAREPLSAFPQSVGFLGQDIQKRTVVVSSSDGPFTVLGATCELKGLRIILPDPIPTTKQSVMLVFDPTETHTASTSVDGIPLRIDIDHPKRKSVSVRVVWIPTIRP